MNAKSLILIIFFAIVIPKEEQEKLINNFLTKQITEVRVRKQKETRWILQEEK